MSQRVVLRLTPEYRFEYDDSLEEAELVSWPDSSSLMVMGTPTGLEGGRVHLSTAVLVCRFNKIQAFGS
jgi:hypothetical protein